MSALSHKWTHFSDLPEDPSRLADAELAPLRRVWLEQKDGLEEHGLVSSFTQKLVRD